MSSPDGSLCQLRGRGVIHTSWVTALVVSLRFWKADSVQALGSFDDDVVFDDETIGGAAENVPAFVDLKDRDAKTAIVGLSEEDRSKGKLVDKSENMLRLQELSHKLQDTMDEHMRGHIVAEAAETAHRGRLQALASTITDQLKELRVHELAVEQTAGMLTDEIALQVNPLQFRTSQLPAPASGATTENVSDANLNLSAAVILPSENATAVSLAGVEFANESVGVAPSPSADFITSSNADEVSLSQINASENPSPTLASASHPPTDLLAGTFSTISENLASLKKHASEVTSKLKADAVSFHAGHSELSRRREKIIQAEVSVCAGSLLCMGLVAVLVGIFGGFILCIGGGYIYVLVKSKSREAAGEESMRFLKTALKRLDDPRFISGPRKALSAIGRPGRRKPTDPICVLSDLGSSGEGDEADINKAAHPQGHAAWATATLQDHG
eukprot:TRINITY_DN16421_c0_g1_i1.p1 TRINITY_DN16421_c0_g1~~TRINITY_DN16421_c0_g1_i1.p1  ORF type:complete len:444 (+),score=76.37 TRINITY_DN16421_c0_g1_i1:149-1480(+)